MIIFVALFLCFVAFALSDRRLRAQLRNFFGVMKLPGPPRHPYLLGNAFEAHTTPDELFKLLRKWSADYSPVYKLYLLVFTAVNLTGPEDCELVLSNTKHINKGPIYDLLHSWLGTGLLTSSDAKWQSRRKILTPAFHFSILQQFVNIFNEEGATLVEELQKECDKPAIAINKHIIEYTLKTIAETSMGTSLEFKNQKERDYKQAIIDIGEIYVYRIVRPWLIDNLLFSLHPRRSQEKKLVETLHKFTSDVIEERQKNFTGLDQDVVHHDVYKKKKRLAMLDLMLAAKMEDGSIDDKGIREEVDTFMFEGHDTTAAALGFTLLCLANHKEYQSQIYQEMAEVMGDAHKKPTYADLQEMKLLERCIKEVLRLYPSVAFIARELGEEMITSTGHRLGKGNVIFIHIFDLHRNPAIYPDPEKFDPDRFLPENSQDRHPFAYLPFSAGPRNCIGQKFAMLELKAAICSIISNFHLEPVDTPETIVLVIDAILRTKDPIKLRFVPRKQ